MVELEVSLCNGEPESMQMLWAHLILWLVNDAGREVDGRHIVVQFAKYGRKDEPMWVSISNLYLYLYLCGSIFLILQLQADELSYGKVRILMRKSYP